MSHTSSLELQFVLYAAFIKYSAKNRIFVQTTNVEGSDGVVCSFALADCGMRSNAALTPIHSAHVYHSSG
tara:strand:+ start:258 stop:467 length:210 start_codon:yes stop_codon:yes gene_type:complete